MNEAEHDEITQERVSNEDTPMLADHRDKAHERLAQWQKIKQLRHPDASTAGKAGEWSVAAQLGESPSEEQIAMIANLYGR